MPLIYFPSHGLVGVGEVQAGGGDVVELLARTGRGLRDVDDVQDLGTAEAGDLHSTHAGESMACSAANLLGGGLGAGLSVCIGRLGTCALRPSLAREAEEAHPEECYGIWVSASLLSPRNLRQTLGLIGAG